MGVQVYALEFMNTEIMDMNDVERDLGKAIFGEATHREGMTFQKIEAMGTRNKRNGSGEEGTPPKRRAYAASEPPLQGGEGSTSKHFDYVMSFLCRNQDKIDPLKKAEEEAEREYQLAKLQTAAAQENERKKHNALLIAKSKTK